MSSAKWRPFCLGLNVLDVNSLTDLMKLDALTSVTSIWFYFFLSEDVKLAATWHMYNNGIWYDKTNIYSIQIIRTHL